ncbi:hypothetical protein CAPTEDRAFT_215001 [Capitella teleta]|uniref:SSD domain-containing protein n=1 Tax=Capitella teleta TaxID=283909 RepID=R7TKR7_CAPTE|nr:hypothetical protein CAPTEDRAFT_215001 [Capitella teleta]|eukprot:ELT92141.1 hypothetical protein CAPTEDRAFT_215001 [Capitella teleta]
MLSLLESQQLPRLGFAQEVMQRDHYVTDDSGWSLVDLVELSYYRFLVRHPIVVILCTILAVVVCAGVAFGLPKYGATYLFDCLEQPVEGFIVRGSTLSGRGVQLTAVSDSIRKGILTGAPRFGPGKRKKRSTVHTCANSFVPGTRHAALTVDSVPGGSDLLQLDNFKSLCEARERIGKLWSYEPCPESVFTIADLIGTIFRKSCHNVSNEDIIEAKRLMGVCMNATAPSSECVPLELAWTFVDRDYKAGLLRGEEPELTRTRILVATRYATEDGASISFYHSISDIKRISRAVEITGMQASSRGVDDEIFRGYLISDLMFFGVAMLTIVVIMLLYTRSMSLVLATFLGILFSFIMAYFVYHYILQMRFFPFLNILALLVLIAVGADDVFVFHDAWQSAKQDFYASHQVNLGTDNPAFQADGDEDPPTPENSSVGEQPHPFNTILSDYVMPEAFGHAIRSVLITSLTTAAAFATNFASKIVVIRCFGIFGMSCILVNFVLMMTWIPAFVVCRELFDHNCCFKKRRSESTLTKITKRIAQLSDQMFHNILPMLTTKAFFVWLVVCIGMGIGGLVLSFVNPRLKMPTSVSEMQFFPPGNILEKYKEIGPQFLHGVVDATTPIRITFIFGVSQRDTTDHLDPFSKGKLELVPFSIASTEDRESLQNFCHALKEQTWLSGHSALQCYLDAFYDQVISNCSGRTGCCEKEDPHSDDTFKVCFANFTSHLPAFGTPLYKNDKLVAFMFSASTILNDTSFDATKKLLENLNNFVKVNQGTLKDGYAYSSFFYLFDMQDHLGTGMWTALWISLGISVIILFLTTMNLLISLYSVITIAVTIFTTFGSLVLLGWELNIVESAIMTLAVGLSIDFTIHYGVAYVQSSKEARSERVKESFQRVGSSVTMAGLTTFMAGAMIMPSHILAYRQLGIFLMLVMVIAWFSASFLFQSMCAVFGPRGEFLQFRCQKKVDDKSDAIADIAVPVVGIEPSLPKATLHHVSNGILPE